MKNRVLVVMGVSGSGKTTIARRLAERFAWPFMEGDALHPPANVAKMSQGIPLTDADRWPWLRNVAGWVDQQLRLGQPGIVTCSMLKRAYRDLVVDHKPGACTLYLRGDRALIEARMARRRHHFMPLSLLDSQFATLEPPAPDEAALTVDVAGTVDEIVAHLVEILEKA